MSIPELSYGMEHAVKTKQVCYCFGYSEEVIIQDVLNNKGVSTILERIAKEKKKGGCNCGTNHPLGR